LICTFWHLNFYLRQELIISYDRVMLITDEG
jgi:hypothetical protein